MMPEGQGDDLGEGAGKGEVGPGEAYRVLEAVDVQHTGQGVSEVHWNRYDRVDRAVRAVPVFAGRGEFAVQQQRLFGVDDRLGHTPADPVLVPDLIARIVASLFEAQGFVAAALEVDQALPGPGLVHQEAHRFPECGPADRYAVQRSGGPAEQCHRGVFG